MFPTEERPHCGITRILYYVNLFQRLTRQPVFIQALSTLISVCEGVYERRGGEYEKERGRVEIIVGGSVLSMCAMINRKREVAMCMFMSMLVTVKDEYVYNNFFMPKHIISRTI